MITQLVKIEFAAIDAVLALLTPMAFAASQDLTSPPF